MANIANLLTEHIDIWTAADTEKKSGRGRARGNTGRVYGVKKLRELILQLAISGKFLDLKKYQFNTFFLDDLGEWGSGGTPLKTHHEYYGGNIPWLVIGDLNDGLVLISETKITSDGLKNSSAKMVPKGSLLIAMYGSIGKLGIAGIDCATNQAIAFCIPDNKKVTNDYFFIHLMAIRESLLSKGQGLAQQNISQKILKATKIQLPELVEQHRIVAKVHELMALCDQLEQQHSNAQEAHETLVSQLLATLTQSQNAAEFNANWQRIYANFDVLFTTESNIDALKQTLLQLAVMGKLVPQDPNDEPASELLKRIQAEKAKLIAEGKLKKEKPLAPISEDEKPFELPKGWEWIALETIAQVGTGATPLRSKPEYFNPATVSWVTSGETSGSYIFKTEQYVSPLALKETNLTVYPKGSLIVAMYGQGKTRGQITELMIEACTNQACAAIRLYMIDDFHRKYVKLFFEKIYDEIRELSAGGAQPNLNLSKVKDTLIPLPPLAEQHRIVAKVDALMALCDQLKTRIQQANQQQQTIADALVAQAVA